MTLDATTVLARINAFVRSRFDIAADDPDFGNDVHLFDYGYLDSFGAQALIEHLESTYEIAITDGDLVKYPLNTLSEISRFVVDSRAGVR